MEFSILYMTYRPGGFDILADSLQNQTFKDYELIIVDDHPVDRREIVKKYLEEQGIAVAYIGPCKPKCFPDIAYNVANTINTGFSLSTKEVVIILQDYQWLPPDCLEKIARHEVLFKQSYCVILPGFIWQDNRARSDQGLISIWERHWRGRPEQQGCGPLQHWVPAAWEFACIALPWNVIAEANGWPECYDSYAAIPYEPVAKRLEAAGGKPYVDTANAMEMINHRDWVPKELWSQSERTPKGSTEFIDRENCFDLKKHVRGKAYWLEKNRDSIFQKREYWCGELGYRPGPDGIGYRDFPIHQVKVDYILSRKPQGKVLDIGCAMGYLVRRLHKAGVDAWGIDVSRYALSQAPTDVKPYLKLGSAEHLPFNDKEFDMAVSFSTFEHLPPEMVTRAVMEAGRVANWGIISVTPGDDPHFDEDITHKTKQPLSWWRMQFPAKFEVRNDADEEWVKTRQMVTTTLHATMKWADYNTLSNSDFFLLTSELVNLEVALDKERVDSLHVTRRFEYPWIYYSLLPFNKDDTVLEAGPGNTVFQFFLAKKVREVCSIDTDPEAVNWLNKVRNEQAIHNVFPTLGDLTDLRFAPDFFNKVICISTLEHVAKGKVVDGLDELIRVTKPGGKIAITMDIVMEKTDKQTDILDFIEIAKRYSLVIPEFPQHGMKLSVPPYNFPFAVACILLEKET